MNDYFEITKKIWTLVLIFISILVSSYGAYGQWDNNLFFKTLEIDSSKSRQLNLTLDHLSFVRNNEYFSPLLAGYTLFGSNTSLNLEFRPYPNIILRGGIFHKKIYGSHKISDIRPLLSIAYLKNSNTFIFGNLNGSLNHDLIEPLYDFEKRLIDPLETGIQYILNNKGKYYLDTWIAWEENAIDGIQKQEQFSFGINLKKPIYKTEKLIITANLQWILRHRGGQISPAAAPVNNYSNGTIGAIAKYNFNEAHYLKGSIYGVTSGDYSPNPVLENKVGNGVFVNLEWKSKPIGIMLSYWNSSDYFPVQGGRLYSSYSSSIRSPEEYEENRQLLIFRIYKDFLIYPDFSISLRLEPFYDFNNKRIEHSLGVYFIYNGAFSLLK